MKLRKLEVLGFKSFYEKTTFTFSDGITAIVGPNGCGKSNIVDAIRWVLGEHAASHLRSKVLQDVIFKGSEAAGPLGMAEVTLTFANDDGMAPPGYESYAEIEITRRTFRDGDSEFFINKVPCRLKDITELFLDTGSGARGYAIIEQGKITSIVEGRPEEKRMIVEEAAGVAKFRLRKREAERKMDSTRQNLSRVKDVTDEVRRQLGSLERQVRKAEKFKVLKDELRVLDAEITSRRRRNLLQVLERLSGELAAAEESLDRMRSGLASHETERETERIRQSEAEAVMRTLQEAHAGLKQDIARREAELSGKWNEIEILKRRISETADEIRQLEREISEMEVRLTECERDGQGLAERLVQCRERRETLSGAAEEARTVYQQTNAAHDRSRADLMVRISNHSTASSGAASLADRISQQDDTLIRLEEREREAVALARSVEGDHLSATRAAQDAREALESAEAAWEDAGRRLAEESARFAALTASRIEAERAHQVGSSRLGALEELHGRRDWASSGVRAVLSHFPSGEGAVEARAGLVHGVIGELIDTEPAYEKAVEAYLGERMQSVVVSGHEAAFEALSYLKQSSEGRSAFVPISLRRRENGNQAVSGDGVVAAMADVVRTPARCGELVRGLVGDTLIVRDLDSATALWKAGAGWTSFVTLEGDVLAADGTLVGGSAGSVETGVLARKREIRDLEGELSVLSAEVERLAKEEELSRLRRSDLESLQEESFRAREARKSETSIAEQRLAVLAESLKAATGKADALKQEAEYLRGDLSRMREELERLYEAARISEQAKGEEEARVADLAKRLEQARLVMEESQAAFHSADKEWAGLEQQERGIRGILTTLRESLVSKRSTVEDRRRREADAAERIARLTDESETARKAIDDAMVELSERHVAIEQHQGVLAEITARVDALEQSNRETRRRENEFQEVITELRLSSQRAESELTTLDELYHQRYEVHPSTLPAPPVSDDPEAEELAYAEKESRAVEVRSRMAAIGDVNLGALDEHKELSERHAFLQAQKEDLEKSLDDLAKAIQRINRTTRERFLETFEKINETLKSVFPKLFLGNGRAFLKLLDEENILESGVELVAQLPGKTLLPLGSLSGGEKSLAGAALIFAIFLVKPSPFCLLDEADAALDPANVDRFNGLIREMSTNYQFLMITHDKRTMELADFLYGITMEKPGISKVVSVKFES
jgi:chromosome segregation protein